MLPLKTKQTVVWCHLVMLHGYTMVSKAIVLSFSVLTNTPGGIRRSGLGTYAYLVVICVSKLV